LGQDVISFKDEFYWFNRHLDYEYDVEHFLFKLGQAYKANTLIEKAESLGEAIAIVKGIYLPDIDSSWATIERERLWRLYADATLELARIHLESGSFNTALDYCHKILTEDKCLEEAHRLAMRAYAAKGNRAGVIRQFEICRQALMEEIQTLPSPQTASLYETLRS
jgi:two-component SAPR family response regulator